MIPLILIDLFRCIITSIFIACIEKNDTSQQVRIFYLILTPNLFYLCSEEEAEPGRTGHPGAAHSSSTKKTAQDGEFRKFSVAGAERRLIPSDLTNLMQLW